MGKFFLLMIIICCGAVFFACSGEKQAETQETPESMEMNVQSEVPADTSLTATCPVCGMEMQKSEMMTYVSEEDTVYFCSEGCQEHYMATAESGSEE